MPQLESELKDARWAGLRDLEGQEERLTVHNPSDTLSEGQSQSQVHLRHQIAYLSCKRLMIVYALSQLSPRRRTNHYLILS